MELLQELRRSKEDHEQRMKLTTRFSYLIDKAIEQAEKVERYEVALEEISKLDIDLVSMAKTKRITSQVLEKHKS